VRAAVIRWKTEAWRLLSHLARWQAPVDLSLAVSLFGESLTTICTLCKLTDAYHGNIG
jgi:hypothetical protein